MAETKGAATSGKGKAFFDRADQVAGTGNWDFAIQLYLEGIRREPDNLERGHQPLREVSLKRKAQGGKSAGMMEALKHRPSKDPLTSLVNAEFLLAKEPGSMSHMVQVLKAARACEQAELVNWIGRIVLEAQRQGKRNKQVLMLLVEAFEGIQEYASAIQACEMAQQLAPNDGKLNEKLSDLSARYTIKKGRYDEEGDFTRAVKDLDKQKELIQRDAQVKSADFLRQQIEATRAEYEAAPTVPGKIYALIDALLKTQDEGDEQEAIDVLAKAHKDLGAYQFKMRIGDIKIRQMKRRYQQLVQSGDKEAALEQARKQLAFELEEYGERAENYPTDLAITFELGKRQFLAGQYDDAIGSLQKAQRDPRRHVAALNYLGQAFSKRGMIQEAADTYERALKTELPEDRKKDIYYNLADTYEKLENYERSQELFSDLAQLDYNYRDVRNRLEQVREKMQARRASGES